MALFTIEDLSDPAVTPGETMLEVNFPQAGGAGVLRLDSLGRAPLVLLVGGPLNSEGTIRSLEALSARRQWVWHFGAELAVILPEEAEDFQDRLAELPPGFTAYADPGGRIRESLGLRSPEANAVAVLDRFRRLSSLRESTGAIGPGDVEAVEQALEELTMVCEECGLAEDSAELCGLCGV